MYTIVGIHDNGLGWIFHSKAKTANEALADFDTLNNGMALAVFEGHIANKVVRNLVPGSPTVLEDSGEK